MPYRPLAILLALLVLVVVPLGVRAEESPVKLGLTPVDVDGSYFDLEMEPGDVEVLTVEFANFGEEPVEVKSFAADAYSLINGGFGVRLIDEPKTGSTHWLDYAVVDDLTLEPEDPVLHTFTVEVPEDATPGDYLTSIVIQTAEPVAVGSEDSNVGFNQTLRHTMAVAIDIPGPREPALAIDGVTHSSNSSRSVVRLGVENPGNQHLAPLAEISIEDSEGALAHEQEIEMRSVYAGTETAVETIINPALEPGDYCANLELTHDDTRTTASSEECFPFTVEAPPEPEPEEDTGVTGLVQPPRVPGDDGSGSWWTLLGIIALVSLLAALFGVLLGRRRGAQAEPGLAATTATEPANAEANRTAQQNVAGSQPPPVRKSGGVKPLLPKRGSE